MNAPDPMKLAEDLTRWAQGLEQQAQRYGELQEQLDRTNATAESPDGAVRVTVDSTGVPTELTITERGRGADPRALSDALLATMRRAQVALREQVSELTSATVGDDGPGNDIVAQYAERFPDPVEESEPGEPTRKLGDLEEDTEDTTQPEEPQPPRRRPTQDAEDDDDFGGPVLR